MLTTTNICENRTFRLLEVNVGKLGMCDEGGSVTACVSDGVRVGLCDTFP